MSKFSLPWQVPVIRSIPMDVFEAEDMTAVQTLYQNALSLREVLAPCLRCVDLAGQQSISVESIAIRGLQFKPEVYIPGQLKVRSTVYGFQMDKDLLYAAFSKKSRSALKQQGIFNATWGQKNQTLAEFIRQGYFLNEGLFQYLSWMADEPGTAPTFALLLGQQLILSQHHPLTAWAGVSLGGLLLQAASNSTRTPPLNPCRMTLPRFAMRKKIGFGFPGNFLLDGREEVLDGIDTPMDLLPFEVRCEPMMKPVSFNIYDKID